MTGVVVLGATGSVGRRGVEVLEAHPDRFRVVALSAARKGPELLELARRTGARFVALADEEAARALAPSLEPGDPEVRSGEAGVRSLVSLPGVGTVLNATTGAAGLPASLEAARLGLRLALANKESLVVAGPLLVAAARASGAEILPVDSEHAAIHQCLRAGSRDEVRRIVLTASGGPFLGATKERLSTVTPAEALRHPTWDMGPRITVDSATLMNKALEVVEARWLFDLPPDRIEVVVHPQSVVHSLVEFVDGSVVAQMGPPDMRTPLRYALGWPERLPAPRPRFDVRDYANLRFLPPDRDAFPALELGFEAARRGGTAGAALNAADEVAVERFLGGDLPFDAIPEVCAAALRDHPYTAEPSPADLERVDAWARDEVASRMPTLIACLASATALAAAPGHSTLSLVGAFLGIGFLIFVHELGHFLACRATGTRVETFSIGFGPRLFGWEKKGGTRRFTVGGRRSPASEGSFDWRISAIPLGGYVKMAGEVGGDGSPGSVADAPRAPRADEYPGKPFGSKAFIISAGVLMNFLAAGVLYGVAFASGIEETAPVVGRVEAGGPAWLAGVRDGDRVVSFDGSPIRSFESLTREIIYARAGKSVDVVVERDGKRETLVLTPRYAEDTGHPQADVRPAASWTVDDGAAPKFTIGPAERVLVEGRPVLGGSAASSLAAAAAQLGKESIRVERPEVPGEPPRTVRLPQPGPDSKLAPEWKLGVSQGGPAVVKAVRPGGEAERAGLRAGDAIAAVDGVPLGRVDTLRFVPKADVLQVVRGKETLELRAGASDPAAADRLVASLELERGGPVVVFPDGRPFPDGKSPAGEAGVRAGDVITAVEGKAVSSWDELKASVASLDEKSVKLEVRGPDGTKREVVAHPKRPAELTPLLEFVGGEGRLAYLRAPVQVDGPLGAVAMAATRTWSDVRDIGRMLRGFFRGDISAKKSLGGPGTIVSQSSTTAREGWGYYLAFLAFISVNLAVLNILPIPLLDGGSMALLLVERMRRGKPLREATVAWFQWAGLALLLLLMYFAISNDVRLLSK